MSEWKNGLCDCFGSCSDCLLGYFCPCILACVASQNANQGTLMSGLQCCFYPLLIPLLRNTVRSQNGISGSCCSDIIAGWCCPCCATIQIKREFD